MKRLYIVRHGAAQSSYEVDSDYARRLTARGVERVRTVGQILRMARLVQLVLPLVPRHL